MGFPTCWCAGRVPDPVADLLDQAYRDVLAEAIPQARDEAEFRRELAVASTVRLFVSLEWHLDSALKGDSNWGIATQRNRILWHLQAAIEATQRADALPGLRGIFQVWLRELEDRWLEMQPLPLFPAFAASRGS
jgi:hypothetical protein